MLNIYALCGGLIDLDRSGFSAFEQIFDDAADRVRIVGLFSPT